MTVLVEGFAPDAVALAALLRGEGSAVRLAGPGPAPPDAIVLRARGVTVDEHADLDADPGVAEVAYLDVWTPETAPRVRRLRAAGTRLSCLSDLLLERAPGRTLGVTGTAGKTTTAAFAVQLLRAAGIEVAAGTSARAANLWATEELVPVLQRRRPPALLALELTSSHLAFMRSSPDVAVITAFWPDHLELHGSLAAYRAAKETIVRHQAADGWVVVNEDDPEAAAFAALTPARRASCSLRGPVSRGAFLAGARVVARWDDAERELGRAADLPLAGTQRANVLTAVAAALAAGAALDALPETLGGLQPPPHRAHVVVARGEGGVEVVDDGLAATPAKAAATLATYPDRSVVLLAGGDPAPAGRRAHAAPEERVLLERACDEAARAARAALLFGPAAAELDGLLRERGVDTGRAQSLDEALEQGLGLAAAHGCALLFAPFYPVDQAACERLPALARAAAGGVRR